LLQSHSAGLAELLHESFGKGGELWHEKIRFDNHEFVSIRGSKFQSLVFTGLRP
jgi:hypothetical protein